MAINDIACDLLLLPPVVGAEVLQSLRGPVFGPKSDRVTEVCSPADLPTITMVKDERMS